MKKTFRSLSVRNYRLYFVGQLVSICGTWMQSTAQIWLVLKLTNSGTALGVTTALQFLPILVFGAWCGLIADRFDKRRLLILTQSLAAVLAFVFWTLTATGGIRIWSIWLLAFLLGCVNAADTPARQAFVTEMVGPDEVANAVGLNSAVFTGARIVGPAVAGVLIATVGVTPCFLVNALSFFAVLIGLVLMRPDELMRGAPLARKKGQVREGLRYVWHTPELRQPLLLMAIVGTIAFNFQVTIPLMAKFVLHGGGGTYGALASSAMATGSLVGALFTASRGRPTRRLLVGGGVLFGAMICLAAAAPNTATEMLALVPMGFGSLIFLSTCNATLQMASSPEMRGRVMALYAVVFLGSTPVGGPIVGYIGQHFGARASLAVGGVATLIATVFVLFTLRRDRLAAAVARQPGVAAA